MEGTTVINKENQAVLACRLYIAQNFWTRLKGLLGTTELAEGKGLLIYPCSSIHTFGMKYPIDVFFLSHELEVLEVVDSIAAGRAACCFKSAMALELPAGMASKTKTIAGHHLVIT